MAAGKVSGQAGKKTFVWVGFGGKPAATGWVSGPAVKFVFV